ncbi:acyltransferase family protein [Marivirga sp.]|uniref:acyltransferase family protein n=1 Tax=Marivirga sp. TaxID=2018662 RepID=UPI003DA730D1
MKNSIKTKNTKLEWVNYAKGIAIILVVYRHILIGIERSGIDVQIWLKTANEIVYSFRMPLFFVLSGIFVAKSIAKRQGNEFLKTKFNTIFYPYLIWGVIQISIQIILSNYTNANRDLLDFLYLLIHPRAIDQLWYLYALFNSSILFFLFYQKLKLNKFWLLIIGIALYGLSVFVKEYSLIHDIFYYFIFFVLGHVTSEILLNRDNYKFFYSFKPFLILTPFFWFSQWYWLNNQELNIFLFGLIAILGTFYVFTISFLLTKTNKLNFLSIVGEHSLYIYLMHLLVVSAIRLFFTSVLNIYEPAVILIVGWLSGVIIPIMIYKYLVKLKITFLFEFPANNKS